MDRLFTSQQTIRGQLALDTDATAEYVRQPEPLEEATSMRCDICRQPIVTGERWDDDGGEIAHDGCARHWFRSQWGAEALF